MAVGNRNSLLRGYQGKPKLRIKKKIIYQNSVNTNKDRNEGSRGEMEDARNGNNGRKSVKKLLLVPKSMFARGVTAK